MMRTSVLLLLLGLVLGPAGASADPLPTPRGREWRFERVPADDPVLWPRGDWRPVPRAMLDEFLHERHLPSAAITAPDEHLWRAEYHGRLDQGVLRGTGRLFVSPSLPAGSEVLLEPLSFRLGDIRAGETSVTWGLRSDGKTIVIPPAGATELTTDWKLLGRPVFDSWEYDVQLPVAAASRVVLDLPAEMELRTSAIIDGEPVPQEEGAIRRWTLETGRRTQLRFAIGPATPPAPGAVLIRETHAVTVQGDGIDVLSDLEVAAGSPTELRFELDPRLQITTAILGADTRIPFQLRTNERHQLLSVPLPATGATREARIRLRGFTTTEGSGARPIPVPRLLNAESVESQLSVHVRPPLVVRSFELDGYRSIDRRSDADQVETWVFQALRREPTLAIAVATSPPQLTMQVIGWADYRTAIARLRTRLLVEGGGGPTFELRALCPADWDVVKVAPFRGEAATIIAGFETTPSEQLGWQRLSIQLRQPLEAEDQLDLLVSAVTTTPRLSTPLPVPCLRPEGTLHSTGVLAVVPPAGAEISGSFPLLSGPVTPNWLSWLQATALESNLSSAQLFDLSSLPGPADLGTLTFDPIPSSREPAPAPPPSANTTASADASASSEIPAPPALAHLRLTSRLSAEGSPTHVHEAEYMLSREFSGVCRFSLPPVCTRVDLLVDGAPVNLRLTPEGYETPVAITARRTLTVQYCTSAASGYLQTELLPLPAWGDTSPPLEWIIQPSGARACYEVDVPFGRVSDRRSMPWSARCFGPLARHLFEPSRKTLADVQTPSPIRTALFVAITPFTASRGVLRVEAATAPSGLRFDTWNPDVMERAAWAVLMLTMIVGGVVRRRRSSRLRRLLPLACVVLLACAWFAPDPFVRPAGAAFVGSLLALGLPRRMMTRRVSLDPGTSSSDASPSETRPKIPVPALPVGLLMLILWGLTSSVWSQPPPASGGASAAGSASRADAADPTGTAPLDGLLPERDGEAAVTAYLTPAAWTEFQIWNAAHPVATRWLLRRAEYEMTLDQDAAVTVRYDVLIRRSRERIPVRLALDGVRFASSDSVTINGQPGTIIPASQGGGVILLVDPPPASEETAPPAAPVAEPAPWDLYQIEIRCRAAITYLDGRWQVSFRVPPVASTTVQLASISPDSTSVRLNGIDLSEGDRRTVAAGGATRVDLSWTLGTDDPANTAQMVPPVAAATLLDVAPLRQTARTTVWLGPVPHSMQRRWSLPLRSEWIVQSVETPANLRWRMATSGEQPVLELVAGEGLTLPQFVTLSSVRAVDASRDPSQTVPLVPLLDTTAGQPEVMAVRGPAGFDVTLFDGGTVSTGVAAAWSELPQELQQRIGTPAGTILRSSADFDWTVRLAPHTTTRTATVDSRMTVFRGQVEWTAVVALDVAGAASPRHELRIDPGFVLSNVTALHAGADRLARTSREGDRLELILSRPQAGPLWIELSGTSPIFAREPLHIPRVDVVDGRTTSETCRVTNASGWDVELTRPGDPPLILPGTSTGAAPSETVLTDVTAERPGQVRLLPGADAAEVESVVQWLADGRTGWQLRQTLFVEPLGTPLSTVQVRVPPGMQTGLKTSPTSDLVSTSDDADGWKTLTFRPARLRAGVYRIQLQALQTLPETFDVWRFTPALCPSARQGDRFVLFDAAFPLRPTSATGITVDWDSVPARVRLLRRTDQTLPVQVHAGNGRWTFAPFNRETPQTAVPLVETIAWLDAPRGLRGRSTFTTVTFQPDQLRVQLPAESQLASATIDGAPVQAEQTGTAVVVNLPADLQGVAVVLNWRTEREFQASDRISLPAPDGWTPEEHVVALLSSGEPATRLEEAATPVEAACRRMAGLLTAVELQSTRTFALDSPLLESLRSADAVLERLAGSQSWPEETAAEFSALRERWRRVHSLIAVRVQSPGETAQAGGGDLTRPWELLSFDQGVSLQTPPPGEWSVRLAEPVGAERPYFAAIALLALMLLVGYIQRRDWLDQTTDWLADHPGLVCLVLGVFWLMFLQPWIVGIVMLVAGGVLAIRRRRRPSRADTALIGPGL